MLKHSYLKQTMISAGEVIRLSAGALFDKQPSYSPLDFMLLFEIIHQTGDCFIRGEFRALLTE